MEHNKLAWFLHKDFLILYYVFVFMDLAPLEARKIYARFLDGKRGPWNASERQWSTLTNWLFLWQGFWIDPWRCLGHYRSHYQNKWLDTVLHYVVLWSIMMDVMNKLPVFSLRRVSAPSVLYLPLHKYESRFTLNWIQNMSISDTTAKFND